MSVTPFTSDRDERPRSRELFRAELPFLSPGFQNVALLAELVLDRGEGRYLYDVDGHRYLDFMAGIGVCSLGYSHPAWVAAMTDQIRKLTVGSFATVNRGRFLRRLAEVAPGDLSQTMLYSGGAEAVEAAVRLAKSYTKKFEVLAFWGGFHGKTGGVLGLMGSTFKHGWGPLHPGLYLTPYAYCERCAFNLSYPGCGLHCLEFAREVIRLNTTGSLAAILVEPIQGTAGNVVPPPEFLPGVQEICREHGALLIADEMLTGFGRTGRLFGCEHDGVVPDVITIGKGMGSGFPVSGLISTPGIMRAEPYSKPSAASSSYGGNPLAGTAAWITLETLLNDNIVANAARVGDYLLRRLLELREKYPFIGRVQGKGLMIGVEFVRHRERDKTLLPGKVMEQVFKESLRRGLLSMNYTAQYRINPPLTLTEAEAEEGVGILDEVCAWLARQSHL
ncbi:MAG: aspartate aminotransferase family protein [Syntrophobacterales bacterium]|nr:aspartate aminotransferase family protein [Syntrophobacterales bacterium]